METITRQQFNDAIEAGIANAPNLTDTERFALRSLNPRYVRVGGFYDTHDLAAPTCPLVQARVGSFGGPLSDAAWPFVDGFDGAFSLDAPVGGVVVEVV